MLKSSAEEMVEDSSTPRTQSTVNDQNPPIMEESCSKSRTQSTGENVNDQDFAKTDCHPIFMRDIYLMKEKWGDNSVQFLTIND